MPTDAKEERTQSTSFFRFNANEKIDYSELKITKPMKLSGATITF